MPINFDTPTVAPPSAEELYEEDNDNVMYLSEPKGETRDPNTLVGGWDPMNTTLMPGTPTTTAAAGTTNVQDPHEKFILDWLGTPSRFDMPMVQQGLDLINQQSAKNLTEGQASLDEYMSSRGLVGSSVEAQGQGQLLSDLNQQREQRMFELHQALANTYGEDMARAATAATQFGQLGLGQGELGLGWQQLFNQEGQFYAEMGQRESEFARTHGLSIDDIALRRDALMQEAQLANRELDITEATRMAELDLRAQQLLEEQRQFNESYTLDQARLDAELEQFNQSMEWQKQQWADEMGLSLQDMEWQREQLQLQFQEADRARMFTAEQQAVLMEFDRAEAELNRLHELGLRAGDHEYDMAMAAYQDQLNDENLLAARAHESTMLELRHIQSLELQAMGFTHEEAMQQADAMLQRELAETAAALEREGWSHEAAMQQAALTMQREMTELELDSAERRAEAEIASQQQMAFMGALSTIIDSLNRWAGVTSSEEPFGIEEFINALGLGGSGGSSLMMPSFTGDSSWLNYMLSSSR